MTPTDDGALVHRLRSADAAIRQPAQAQLYELCQVQLTSYFRRRLRNAGEADDYVHEVFVKALDTILNGNDPNNLAAWLIGIAHNLLKGHYEDLRHYSDSEIPEQAATSSAGPALELDRPGFADDELPELPDDLAEVLGKRELWSVVRVAITAITPQLSRVIGTHIKLHLRQQRRVTTAELAAALDVPLEHAARVDRELHRARKATATAASALVLARSGRGACSDLDQLLDTILSAQQQQAGRELALDLKQSRVVAKHAAACAQCAPRADAAGKYVLWNLGPGLVVLTDDDERRRTVAAMFNRADAGQSIPTPLGNALAATEPVAAAVAGSDVATKPPAVGGLGSTLARFTGSRLVNSVSQVAHDPMVIRAIGGTVAAAVLGICGLLTASTPFSPPPAIAMERPHVPPGDTRPTDTSAPTSQPPSAAPAGPASTPPTTPARTTTTAPSPNPAPMPGPAPKPPAATPTTTTTTSSPPTTTNSTTSADGTSPDTTTTTPATPPPAQQPPVQQPPVQQPPTQQDVAVDARDVAYSSFAVSGGTGWQSTKQIHRMPLAPGPHSLTTALGHRLDFRVTATNTVEYEQAMEGTFTGQGTNTLAVHGTPISLDKSDVDYSSAGIGGAYQTSQRNHVFKLLPGAHYLVVSNRASFGFTVTPQGRVRYAPDLHGPLTGADTNTLALHGFPVTLDVSDVDYSSTGVGGTHQTTERNHTFKLLPGPHYVVVANRASVTFTVTSQGRVDYASDLPGLRTGAGTGTLAVHGLSIILDVTDIDYVNTTVGGVNWRVAQPRRTYKLLPGSNLVSTYNGINIPFTLTAQGAIAYEAHLEGLFTGSGSTTLTVHGFAVTLDTSDVDYVTNTVGGVGWKAPQSRRVFKLLPGAHVMSTYNGINIPFTVSAEGRVGYRPDLEGLFSGTGSTTLTVHGFAVTLDTSDVDYVTNTVGGVGWKAPQSRRVFKLLPGAHVMSTYNGINIPFTVSAEGRVGYRPDLEGLFSGTGSTTLTVHGFAVTLDTSDVDYVTNTVGGVGWKAPQSRRVYKLLPGAHTFVTYNGIQFPFTVTAQGRVDYKSTLNDTFTGIGSATLAVRGHPITFDPRDSGHTSFGVSGVGWRGSGQLVTFRLVRGTHALHLPDGSKFTFQVTDTGKVDYDPSLDGVLSGRGSSTLAVHRRRQR